MEMSHWENWIIEEQYMFYIVFNTTYSCHRVYCDIYLKKMKETNHFQYKYTFYDQDQVCSI